MAVTVPEPLLTTYTRELSGEATAHAGAVPTGIVAKTVLSRVEIDVTELLPWFTAYTLVPFARPVRLTGALPTGISALSASGEPVSTPTTPRPDSATYTFPFTSANDTGAAPEGKAVVCCPLIASRDGRNLVTLSLP
jgi:hypothetical protein